MGGGGRSPTPPIIIFKEKWGVEIRSGGVDPPNPLGKFDSGLRAWLRRAVLSMPASCKAQPSARQHSSSRLRTCTPSTLKTFCVNMLTTCTSSLVPAANTRSKRTCTTSRLWRQTTMIYLKLNPNKLSEMVVTRSGARVGLTLPPPTRGIQRRSWWTFGVGVCSFLLALQSRLIEMMALQRDAKQYVVTWMLIYLITYLSHVAYSSTRTTSDE